MSCLQFRGGRGRAAALVACLLLAGCTQPAGFLGQPSAPESPELALTPRHAASPGATAHPGAATTRPGSARATAPRVLRQAVGPAPQASPHPESPRRSGGRPWSATPGALAPSTRPGATANSSTAQAGSGAPTGPSAARNALPAELRAFSWARPFAPAYEVRASRYFPYGTDANGQYLLHHGVDIGNPIGTPVLSVGDGTVVFAGADDTQVVGPEADFYGNAVVVRHDGTATPLYSLYGHLSEVAVRAGQRVKTGERLGLVGAEGVALGPHLHLEFRTRPMDYESTLNPELFLEHLPGEGTVIGRLLDHAGALAPREAVTLYALDEAGPRWVATTVTYPQEHMNPAPGLGENFLFNDLPAGVYAVTVPGRPIDATQALTVTPGGSVRVVLVSR